MGVVMADQQPPEAGDSCSEPADAQTFAPRLDRTQAIRIVGRRLELLVGGIRLSRIGISRLLRYLETQDYAAGDVILRRGDYGDFMGLVGSGQVAVYEEPRDGSPADPDGSTCALLLQPGSTFGEAMLLSGRPCGSTLYAVSDTRLYVLNRQDLLAVAAQRSARPRQRSSPWWAWLASLVLLSSMTLLVAGLYYMSVRSGRNVSRLPRLPFSAVIDPGAGAPQLVTPTDGQLLQRARSIRVQALISQAGNVQAELQIDGRPQGRQINSVPENSSWQPEWTWEDAGYGSHVLAVHAFASDGDISPSPFVTVTVVPSGTLAFASNRDGSHGIYTISADGHTVIRMNPGPGDTRQPAWRSADSLAYVVEPEVGQDVIRQMDNHGSQVEDLALGRDPAWSLDGIHLAYASSVDGVSQVLIVRPGDDVPVQVTTEQIYAGQPAWSPDGAWLAYVAERNSNWDIWIVAVQGGEPRRLTEDPAMDWAPDWSPDGSQLAFVSDRTGSHQIHVVAVEGGIPRPLTSLPQGAESPAWSPDGLWLAFVTYAGEGVGVSAREIHLMRADGRDQVRLTHNAFDDSGPDWRRLP